VVTRVCVSVPRRIPTLPVLHGPGCKLGELYVVPSSCALLGGFAIGARVPLLYQHSAEREMSASACTRSMPGLRLSARQLRYRQSEGKEAPSATSAAGDYGDDNGTDAELIFWHWH